jgi:hypothetical protein
MIHWTSVGGIPAAGNTNEKSDYALTVSLDDKISDGYIRLTEVDKDGKVFYFNEQALFCEHFQPAVYPNPVRDELQISVPENVYRLSIRQMDGIEVRQMNCEQKNEIISINVQELSSGIYTIYLSTNSKEMFTTKFIKL